MFYSPEIVTVILHGVTDFSDVTKILDLKIG